MRKYRHGGYSALPTDIRNRIYELTGFGGRDRDNGPLFTRATPITALVFITMMICMFSFIALGEWLETVVRDDIHLAGRRYKFASVTIIGGPLLGIFTGILLSGVFTAMILGHVWSPAKNGAAVIAMIERGFGRCPEADRALQDYVLDRTPRDGSPDDFLKTYVQTTSKLYWRWVMPLVIVTGCLFILDARHFERLALEGYRTSDYFQLGSTLHPLDTLQRIETGCRPIQRKDRPVYGKPHYTLYFPDDVSLDLYRSDLKSNYYRLQTIEAYDALLRGRGVNVDARHLDNEDIDTPIDIDELCEAAVKRIYKTRAHERARAVLRLPQPAGDDVASTTGHEANTNTKRVSEGIEPA